MELISKRSELEQNIETLVEYLARPGTVENDFARELITRGICFVATTRDGLPCFSPSRFVGYVANRRAEHMSNPEKDGRVTNAPISEVLGKEPEKSPELDALYLDFCRRVGIERRVFGSFGARRRFWNSL